MKRPRSGGWKRYPEQEQIGSQNRQPEREQSGGQNRQLEREQNSSRKRHPERATGEVRNKQAAKGQSSGWKRHQEQSSGREQHPKRGWIGSWLRLITPDALYGAVTEIDPRALARQGIKGLVIDLDNTICPWGSEEISPEVEDWIRRVTASGIGICLVSNNRSRRAERVGKQLGLPALGGAMKPRRGGLRKAMAILGTGREETAVVGDQVFTDVLAAKRLGLRAFLVKPSSRREFPATRLVRLLEGLWLGYLKKSHRLPGPGQRKKPDPGSPCQGRNRG